MSCTQILTRSCQECSEYEEGRIRALVYIKKDAIIRDYSDNLEWAYHFDKKNAIFIPNVNGTLTSDPITVEGFGAQANLFLAFNNTIAYTEPFNCSLVDFYNALTNSKDYRVIYITSKGIFDSVEAIEAFGSAPIEGIDTINKVSGTVSWRSRQISTCNYDGIPAILKSCQDYSYFMGEYCPPCSPACTNKYYYDFYGNDSYPTVIGEREYDFYFEDVTGWLTVAMYQTPSSTPFYWDTFDFVLNGKIVASAKSSRIGLTGINSLADLNAIAPLNVADPTDFAVSDAVGGGYRISFYEHVSTGTGSTLIGKLYFRGFTDYIAYAFCPVKIPFIPVELQDPKNGYTFNGNFYNCFCCDSEPQSLGIIVTSGGEPPQQPDNIIIYETGEPFTVEFEITGLDDVGALQKICCESANNGLPLLNISLRDIANNNDYEISTNDPGPHNFMGGTWTLDVDTLILSVNGVVDDFTLFAVVRFCGITVPNPIIIFQSEVAPCVISTSHLTSSPGQTAQDFVTEMEDYLVDNTSVDFVTGSSSQQGLVYAGGLVYNWDTTSGNLSWWQIEVMEQPDGSNLSCCPDYQSVIDGSTIRISMSSICTGSFQGLKPAGGSIDFSVAGYAISFSNSGGILVFTLENENSPTPNPCVFTIEVYITYCEQEYLIQTFTINAT